MLAMLGELKFCLLGVVVVRVVLDIEVISEGLSLDSGVICEGLLLDWDRGRDLVGRVSDKVMLGKVGSEGFGSVMGSDLGFSDGLVMVSCCCFSLSRLP